MGYSLNRLNPLPPVNRPDPPAPPQYTVPGPVPGFYPLTIGRTVSLAFSLFRFGWRTFVAINLIAAVPVVLATAAITVVTYDQMSSWESLLLLGSSSLTTAPRDLVALFPWQAAAATLVVSLLAGAVTVIGTGALIHAIGTALTGRRLSTREAYSVALRRVRDLLVVYVVLTLIGLGLTLIVVLSPLLLLAGPGAFGDGGPVAFLALVVVVAVVVATVFLLIRTIFTVEVLMLEDLPGVASIRRSYSLVRGSMLRVIGYSLIFALIASLIGLVASFVSVLVGFALSSPTLGGTTPTVSSTAVVAQTLITSLFSEVLSPILSIGFVLLYFDVRWRHGERVPVPGGGETAGRPQPEVH